MSGSHNHHWLLFPRLSCKGKKALDVNKGKGRLAILVYRHRQLEQTARTSALQVRHRSVGLKDVSSPERLRHLNMRDNKAGQKLGISAVSAGA